MPGAWRPVDGEGDRAKRGGGAGGGALTLNPIALDTDPTTLARDLAPGFGGDPEPARAMLEQTLGLLTREPRPDPWGCYLASADGRTVGTCAFKAAPDAAGAVEIAYMAFPAFERQGHATAMAAALVEIAAAAGAPLAIAHTLPEENASNRALRRNGFTFAGEVEDHEDGIVWRWEKPLGECVEGQADRKVELSRRIRAETNNPPGSVEGTRLIREDRDRS